MGYVCESCGLEPQECDCTREMIHYSTSSAVFAFQARVKELEEQQAAKYWERIRADNTALRAKLAEAEKEASRFMGCAESERLRAEQAERERDILRVTIETLVKGGE